MSTENRGQQATHFEFARAILATQAKIPTDEIRKAHFQQVATIKQPLLALILFWLGAIADTAPVNEFFLGLAIALGDAEDDPYLRASLEQYEAYRRDAPVAEILGSIRESEPPDDTHFSG